MMLGKVWSLGQTSAAFLPANPNIVWHLLDTVEECRGGQLSTTLVPNIYQTETSSGDCKTRREQRTRFNILLSLLKISRGSDFSSSSGSVSYTPP